MDYADYQAQQQQQQSQSQQQQQQPQQHQQSQSSPQRVWAQPPQLLTTANQSPFPSPTSSSTYYFSHQPSRTSTAAASPTNEPRPTTANLSLNMSSLTVTSPTAHSPIGPLPHSQGQQGSFQDHAHHAHPHAIPQHPHHAHSHSHSSSSALGVSPITPVSPQNFNSPVHLSTQPAFTFNFDDTTGAGLSPNPDPLTQRRLSTGSHSTSSSELAVEKSVPRKRSLTGALPASHSAVGGHPIHSHSHSHSYSNVTSGAQGYTHAHGHSLPHPIITTTASSPPPPASPTSPSSSHASHSFSLSHSHSHPSLSQQSASQSTSHSSFQSQPQLDVNGHASASYDEMDGPNSYIVDDVSDDEYGTAFTAGYGLGGAGPSKPGANQNATQAVMGKPITTNNFVTKLYQMINDTKSQHFITWTEHGSSFVVSNVGEFSRNILGSHFKHNNFSSFVRQLNMYGFHKINRTPRAQRTSSNPQIWEFSHPKFLRARPDLLEAIKRKALEPDPRERSRVELPGEVARLLSDMREENQALWRAVKQLGGRIPPHIASTLGSSGNSHSHSQSLSLPSSQGQHTITPSRSSSNLGDDTDRDVDWEDDEPGSGGPGGGSSGTDAFGGLNMHTTMGAPSPLSLAGPSPSLHSHSPSLHAHSPSPHPPSPSEEWRRWAETEISRERRRVDKLVNVVRAFVEHVNVSPGAGPGQGGGLGTNVGTGKGGEGGEEVLAVLLRDLHALSLEKSSHPSSPSISPHPMHSLQLQAHSPNIFVTSPTSPSPFPPLHGPTPHPHSAARAGLPTLTIPTAPAYALHTPSSSPTAADLPGSCFGQRSFGTRTHSHSSQPSITLTPDDDSDSRGDCKRARMEATVSADGSSNVGMGVANSAGGGDLDMTTDSEEDSKLHTPVSLTGAPCSRPRSDSTSVWASGGDGGMSGNPNGGGSTAGGVVGWGRGRSGSGYGR